MKLRVFARPIEEKASEMCEAEAVISAFHATWPATGVCFERALYASFRLRLHDFLFSSEFICLAEAAASRRVSDFLRQAVTF